jgi:hypothetical protein
MSATQRHRKPDPQNKRRRTKANTGPVLFII